MQFNINHKVRVKLTDMGRLALMQQHAEFWYGISQAPPYAPPKEDAEGWSEWQLWCLMQDLGHLCGMGCSPPFETVIELVVPKQDAA